MLASDIISRAGILLHDTSNVRWTSSELLKWISDGQRVIALVRPDSCSANTVMTLAAGTKQTLPADAMRLLDVVRNITAAGGPDRAVRMVERETLDAQDLFWHTRAATGKVSNFTYDNRNPGHFYVYPQATAGMKLEVIYSKSPTEVTTTGQTLELNDLYAEPLLNYVMFRAYSKDAEFAANQTVAQGYLSIFTSMLGIKTGKDFAFSPDANKPGGTPNLVAAQAGGV